VTDTRTRKQKRRDRAAGAAEEGAWLGGCCLLDGCLSSLILVGAAWGLRRLL